jgi:hypothetical protein
MPVKPTAFSLRLRLHYKPRLLAALGNMKLTEKQLTRAIYSSWDFQQALSALTFLLEECEYGEEYHKVSLRRFRCFESTLIISIARPFESSRNGTTVSLKAIGIRLAEHEKTLVERVMYLRRKIIAHSDEEEMHFRIDTFEVLEGEFVVPHMQFDEGLFLTQAEVRELEVFLRRLKQEMTRFFLMAAKECPELFNKYQTPLSMNQE